MIVETGSVAPRQPGAGRPGSDETDRIKKWEAFKMVGKIIHPELGAIELARKNSSNDGFIVLAVIPKRGEFVTWWMSSREDVMVTGHYLLTLKDAWEDFNERN